MSVSFFPDQPTWNPPAMHDSRTGDRTPLYYTMKTPAIHSPGIGSSKAHSHSHSISQTYSQSMRSAKPSKSSSTPIASPRMPYSVGQNHPPKLSPRVPEVRAPSPNYFGLVVESGNDPRESSGLPRDHWSPSPSSIKSFAAALPKQVPLDANPEFEAFKRQADLNRGKSFPLASTHYSQAPPNLGPIRPRAPPRWHSHSSDSGTAFPTTRTLNTTKEYSTGRVTMDHDNASLPGRQNPGMSLNLPNMPRFESPRAMDASQARNSLTRAEDRDPRLSVMEHRVDPPSPGLANMRRAVTVPPKLENGQAPFLSGSQLRDLLQTVGKDRLLILDMRSAQSYNFSRITGALNLCVPTTLLKRATFNVNKLRGLFSKGSSQDKFSQWREMEHIIVYDSFASDQRDALSAQSMVKKFTNEGYKGGTGILRGGFSSFQESFPELVDTRPPNNTGKSDGSARGGVFAPVIGGVCLPMTKSEPNPFFSNIRQNMDLRDGVGQLDVARPPALNSPSLPRWLRDAAAEPDHGKKVSDKFLHIEMDEQSRMKAAYAAFNPNNQSRCKVQLCGVEKGGKNRYKDILPFEHARVKLQERPASGCDYVNASHLKASRSNKRYIATQGPLPATFEDFWSVIWQQDVRVIVMLTAESEGGQLKCHPYWKGRDFGPIRLKSLSEKKVSLDLDKHRSESHATPTSYGFGENSRRRANTVTFLESSTPTPKPLPNHADAPFVIVRKFALSHASHPFAPIREITHLHFPSWPDFGTPAQPSHLLALVELANVMQRSALPVETSTIVSSRRSSMETAPMTWYDEPEADSHARPMLVHCSAGCGRTGTFCTVDSVIDMLKRQRQVKAGIARDHDYEGDVSMGDAGDVSPRTSQEFDFGTKNPRLSMDKRTIHGGHSIDTSWIYDDKVDLIQRTVEDFREQRLSMVQSLRQYVLCYETVLEWVNRMNDKGCKAPSGRMRSGSLQQPRGDR